MQKRHKRLNRPEIYRELARISRKNPRLTFPRFCIEAIDTMNPNLNNEPDNNFSLVEGVRGFLSPKPLNHPNRQGDLRIYIDELGRPDMYAMEFLRNQVRIWNKEIRNQTNLLYIYPCEITEIYPATKRREERKIEVIYDYVRVLRGQEFVRHIHTQMFNTIQGLEYRIEFIQASVDEQAVDESVQRVLEENERIRNGEY